MCRLDVPDSLLARLAIGDDQPFKDALPGGVLLSPSSSVLRADLMGKAGPHAAGVDMVAIGTAPAGETCRDTVISPQSSAVVSLYEPFPVNIAG